jgi:hypothetical protein
LAHPAQLDLAGFYERVAVLVGRPAAGQVVLPIAVPVFTGLNGTRATASPGDGDGVSGAGGAVGGAADGPRRPAHAEETDLVRVITGRHHPHMLWVHEHLQHLSSNARAITGPASHVAEQRRLPRWC